MRKRVVAAHFANYRASGNYSLAAGRNCSINHPPNPIIARATAFNKRRALNRLPLIALVTWFGLQHATERRALLCEIDPRTREAMPPRSVYGSSFSAPVFSSRNRALLNGQSLGTVQSRHFTGLFSM